MISTEKHNPFNGLSRLTGYGLTMLSCALLSGCFSADLEELQAYADETLAKKGSAVEPLPPIKAYVRYLYQGEIAGLRDPFDPFFFGNAEMDAADSIDKSTQNKYINEVLTHNREELEYHELDSLRMVGIVQNSREMWGIIRDQDGVVYRVAEGNYLGRNYGKIKNIMEREILLREIVQDSNGRWSERPASISLSEE